jgi:TonB-linked SusC/RagA family outer membrane protein
MSNLSTIERLVFYALIFLPGALLAQKRISGKVTSADDKEPVPGVNVVIQGTTKGTATDFDGNYLLDLSEGENVLVFSAIGYKTQNVTVGQRSVVDVVLESDAIGLQEVVVIGYGAVKKSDLTGAVSSIRGKELNTVPAINPMQSLQGKIAGVQVANTSGAPGAGTYVRIRGIGTFNDSSPIFVVDGVILQNIDFLNAADIASMEVLKDASATAIYGARGANGVIIVTTKKGSTSGNYPTINVSIENSLQQLPKKIDLLSGREYAIVRNKINPGTYNNLDAVPNTDWQDQIFRTAPIQNYQVSIAGGSEKFQYYTSIGYFKQDGIIRKSDYERVSLKFNNTLHLTKAVRLGSNLAFTPYNQQNTNGNAVFVVYRAWPTITPYLPDGSFSPVPGVGNVLADIEYTNSFNKGLRSVNNLYAEVDFLKGFTFKSSFGADIEYNKSRSYTPVFYVNPQQQNATDDLGKGYNDRIDWLWENTLNYQKEKGAHRINAVAGYSLQESSSESVFLGAENLLRSEEDFWYVNIFPNLVSPNTARNNVNPAFNYSMISYLARANYTYNNRYLFTATFRRDGSSKFVSTNRFANFPSLALGWNAINESFLQDSKIFSNLKVRASWGIIGNEKINYLRQYSLVQNGINALFGQDVIYSGATYGVSGNPNLKWESTHQIDIGVETGFLNDRLTAEIDYYQRTTKDILIDLPVPGYYGNGDGAVITFNAGEVVNKGLEINLGYNGEYRDIKYRVGLVGTTIHNETKKISGTGQSDEQLIGLFNGRQVTRTTPGLPIGSFYGYRVIGVFQNTSELNSYPHLTNTEVGDLKFEDVNKDGVLNSADRANLGSPIPKVLAGLSLNVEYKNFDFVADLQAQAGNKIFNGKETVRPDPYNFERRYLNFWNGDGTSNSEPRPSNGGVNYEPSSRYIYNGSFLRLRNISIGYSVPQAISSKVGMKSLRAYARVTNLFTWSQFTGYTPEIVSGNPVLNAIDVASYPIPRIYSVGLNLIF